MNMTQTTVVYLYHFASKLGHAQHYIGSCTNLKERDQLHQAGAGARLLQVARERGIKFWIVRTWRGGRQLERKLKNRHNGAALCPICQAKRRKGRIPDDVDFYGILQDLRTGKADPLYVPMRNDDEEIGQDYSERPYMY